MKAVLTHGKMTNLIRLGVYPIYGFHVWLGFTVWLALRNWQFQNRPQFLFLGAVAGPYFVLLMRYIPHAGYDCLLILAIVLLPACFLPPMPSGGLRIFAAVAAAFVAISIGQWLLIQPVATTSIATGAVNAYAFQYSRSGIKQRMFETLSSIMFQHNIATNMITPKRMLNLRDGGR